MSQDDIDASRAPLLDHLVELRRRLVWSVVALILAFFVCFYFAQPIFNFLAAPLVDVWGPETQRRMIFTALHEQFFTQIKVAFFAAFCVSFPIIAGQFYAFVAPGLYKHEKSAFIPFLVATPILFTTGAAFVYYVVLPVAWRFFLGFEQGSGTEGAPAIELEAKVSEYLSLIMQLIFAFGISFLLPVVLTLLVKAGITSSEGLRSKRRYAIVIAFIAAAILTPPDPMSQIGLAIPIILLYEVSIWTSKLIERKRAERDAELDREAGVEVDDEDDAGSKTGEDEAKSKSKADEAPKKT